MLTVVLKSLRQDFVKRIGLTLTVTENRTHGTPFSMKVLTSTLLMNSLTAALAIFSSFVHTEFSILPRAVRKGMVGDAFQLLYVAYVNTPWQVTTWEAIVTLTKRYRAVV